MSPIYQGRLSEVIDLLVVVCSEAVDAIADHMLGDSTGRAGSHPGDMPAGDHLTACSPWPFHVKSAANPYAQGDIPAEGSESDWSFIAVHETCSASTRAVAARKSTVGVVAGCISGKPQAVSAEGRHSHGDPKEAQRVGWSGHFVVVGAAVLFSGHGVLAAPEDVFPNLRLGFEGEIGRRIQRVLPVYRGFASVLGDAEQFLQAGGSHRLVEQTS
jgi:hypothetical protein